MSDAIDTVRAALVWGSSPGSNASAEALAALAVIEADHQRLTEALDVFANPQHWAIRREHQDPSFVWIGTYSTTPVAYAAAALGREGEAG